MVKKPTTGKALKPKNPRNKVKAQLPVVESAVATETQSGIVIGVLMICAVALLVVFGSSFMAGIVALAGTAPLETAEIGNNYDPNLLAKANYFKILYGNIDNVKHFDVYNASVASYGRYRNSDKCLIDVCVGTKCSPRVVTSCANGENNCRLQEAFVFNEGNYSRGGITKVGNWVYNCPNGCSKGACVIANPTPECTDSDGGPNIYVKGTTKGILAGSSMYIEKSDYCVIEGETEGRLVESYCNDGQVVSITQQCRVGCINGICTEPNLYFTITKAPLSSSTLVNGFMEIAKFNMLADVGKEISWKKINLRYYLNYGYPIDISDCSLINKFNDSVIPTNIVIENGDISIETVEEEVFSNAGAMYAVKCNISDVQSGDELHVEITGDYIAGATPSSYFDIIKREQRFVWSDRSAIPHNLNSIDWYGSHYVRMPVNDPWDLRSIATSTPQ
jgi:hypothetical protein